MTIKKSAIIVILIAILLGAIQISHCFYIKYLVEKNYSEDIAYNTFIIGDAGKVYEPRYREVFEGNGWVIGEYSIKENADSPTFFPPLSAMTVGLIMRLVGDFYYGYLVAKFFITAAIFLLLYWMFNIIFKDKYWSVLASLIYMGYWKIGIMIPFFSIFPLELNLPERVVLLGRMDSPLVTTSFFILFYVFNLLIIKKKKHKFAVLAGISFGLLFYVYFHYWVFAFVILGIWGMLALWKNKEMFRLVCVEFITGLLVSIPYWINLYALNQLPYSKDIFFRSGLVFGRNFNFDFINLYLVCLILLYVIYKIFYTKGRKDLASLYAAIIVSAIVCLNIQVVTGFVPHPDHWHGYAFTLGFWIIWAHVIYYLIELIKSKVKPEKKCYIKYLFILSIIIAFFLLIFNKWHFSNMYYRSFAIPRDVKESYIWLDNHTAKNDIIASPSFTSNFYFNLHTHNKVVSPAGEAALVSMSELLSRFLFTACLFNLPEELVREMLADNITLKFPNEVDKFDRVAHRMLFVNYLGTLSRGKTDSERFIEWSIEQIINESMVRYKLIMESKDDELFNYDYVYFGPFEKKLVDKDVFSNSPKFQKVYNNDSVSIYKPVK